VTTLLILSVVRLNKILFIEYLTEWYHPIIIEMYMPQGSGYSFPVENGQKLMSVHGRLQHGKLHGMVIMNGVLSNDPLSLCSRALFTGLEFIGHYSHGQPRGICWKRLIGNSWIYVEVDSEGEFTGTLN